MAQPLIIPSRPEILLDIQEQMREEEPDVNDISCLMKKDIALYAIFLSAANSPWMGLSQPATSIEHAVKLMGIDRVYTMIQAIMVRSTFVNVPLTEHFWTTAVDVASICSDFASRFSELDRNQAYSIGMLHNVGIAIMMTEFPEIDEFTQQNAHSPTDVLCLKQRNKFDTDHFLQGALMARKWDLDENITQAIRYQPLTEKILTQQKEISESVATYLAILAISKNISAEFRSHWGIQKNGNHCSHEAELALNYLNINHGEFHEVKDDIFDDYMSKTSV